MMKTYSWLGVGVLVLILSWDVPTAQAQATSIYSPSTSNIVPGAQRGPSLTTNYYGLVRAQADARKSEVLNAQQHHQARVRALGRQNINSRTVAGSMTTFMPQYFNTTGIQIPIVRPQRPRISRR